MNNNISQDNCTPPHFQHLRNKFVTIVAFGDSITQVNHWTHGALNWVGMLSMGLHHVFPQGATVINSGMSGNHTNHGLERLERDVIRFEPDIVIVGFGMNECLSSIPIEIFRKNLVKTVSRIQEATNAKVVLRTPNPIIDMYTGREQQYLVDSQGEKCSNNLNEFAAVICEVAGEKNTLLVDHYSKWKKSMTSSCVGDMIMLMGNPIHPNHIGHRRLYYELAPVFNAYRNFFFEWERILRNTGDLT